MATPSVRPPLWVAQLPADASRQILRVLIANRGEIACRIIKTCRAMGITTIAIFADEDSASKHVADADEAISLGSMDQAAGNPFLNMALLIATATQARADAVHPGYGYLSESAPFADAVRQAGIAFIGPSALAMSTLGDKRQAKEYLAKHAPSVPLIPGSTGADGKGIDKDSLERLATSIGFPVMIKASAGGGGKGMRIVSETSALAAEFERAQSEALRSFGSGECILEKYIEAGKHVEVQIIGDSHGTVLSLGERDCSVQRRHQKVVEESPCTWLDRRQREAMCATAVAIGELLGYEGAGTVEFIVDLATGRYYFLEVNARLQVEHPITEECTGLDIVSLQLFVASGGSFAGVPRLRDISQRTRGHAMEVRLCAEDPNRDFAPQHGQVRLWLPSSPAHPRNVRFETAMTSGSKVSIYFDSMIAKVVVWAPTRPQCIDMLTRTLAETVCIGPATNQLFLQSCLLHEKFRRPDYSTAFIPTNLDRLLVNPYSSSLGLPRKFLHVVPGICLREIKRLRSPRRASTKVFGNIRPGFRNQRRDTAAVPCDIITTWDAKSARGINPHVCLWDLGAGPQAPATEQSVQLFPLPTMTDTAASADKEGLSVATKAHNNLTSLIRAGEVQDVTQLTARMHSAQLLRTDEYPVAASVAAQFRLSVNGHILAGHVSIADGRTADTETDAGGVTKLSIHLQALGEPVEYRVCSMLSFFESMRQDIAAEASGDLRNIKSPMPCKVFRVLKKNGDVVKKGEVVMIVESMKMEITVAAGVEGIFETHVREGDAVDEGAQLCLLR